MASKADDNLKEYKTKRNFAKTSEPSGQGEQAGASTRPIFVVQKHDATRLHFDFRVELDGVLKSWAVTRGPSNNPEDKRLAVRVEDHPLAYSQFEGTIPEKEYGGGTVMLWDTGTWEPIGDPHDGLRSGDLKMRLFGQRMKGEWVLVHMKGRDTKRKSGPARENWLLIKHRDEFSRDSDTLTGRFTRSVSTGRDFDGIANGLKPTKASSTAASAVWHSDPEKAAASASQVKAGRSSAKLPKFRAPQLATLVDSVPTGDDWLFEMKYDGYRCQAAVAGDQVRLFTRTGLDWTEKFAAVLPAFRGLSAKSALIDGEICAFDSKGRTDFSTLKLALAEGGALVYFAFDLLELNGKDLSALPLSERKERLEKLLGKVEKMSPLQFSSHVGGNGQKVLDAICAAGHEGIIAKRADAPYRGERSRSWLKIKCARRQEFVVGGWSPSSKKRSFASLLVGTWDGEQLIYRGRVGTGFSASDAEALQKQLEAGAVKTSPFASVPGAIARTAHWVKPELVAEIGFAEFTPDGILRHPSFLGLREDKPGKEISLEMAAKPDEAASEVLLDQAAGVRAAEDAGIKLTSSDRVVYPGQGVTKANLVAYYAAVADQMLPYIANRPLSLLRCPQGRAKYCFFQKHDTGGFPEEMRSRNIREKDGSQEDYFYIETVAGLIAGTQMNVLEWHMWGSRFDDVEKPERLVFDIDPDEGMGFDAVRAAAVDIRDLLEELGLQSFPLVSGGKGVHVVAPLVPKAQWPEVKALCKDIAGLLATREPERFTANLSKAKRKGKLFIDYLRNERGSTAIAPWSSRSREGAPAAVPVSWQDLSTITAANQFTLAAAAERAQDPDPWKGYFDVKQVVGKPLIERLRKLSAS